VLAGTELRFGMFVNARIDTDRINDMLDKYRGAMKFVVGRSPAFVLKTKKLTEKEIWKQVREVVEDITNILMV
jgi:hypothetical protein